MIVMESGYDDDVDQDVRDSIVDVIGEDLLDEDTDEVVDVVLLWYRDGDDDLADVLVDSIAPLADDGYIWLLTPKRSGDDQVDPSDVAEAASIAVCHKPRSRPQAPSGRLRDWSAVRVPARRNEPT